MSNVSELASLLLSSRTQAHIFHLQTPSFARHTALQNYYNRIVPLTNSYIESYQGRTGRIIKNIKPKNIHNDPEKTLKYFKKLRLNINSLNLPRNTELQNILDEIRSLLDSTIYKIEFLH